MLITNNFGRYSCGGRTRTCDLQVMSLASYQLLHSAIFIVLFLFAGAKVRLFCDMTKSFVDLSTSFNIYLSLEMYA